MAVIGLVWALRTVPDRRQRDRKAPISYLPADVDVVAAVHVTRTLEDPTGREFLRQFGLGPDAAGGMIDLTRWTGLRWEDIEEFVVGLKVQDRLFPRLVLVVQTRDPYNAEQVRAVLKANREVERGERTFHRFSLENPPFELDLWCPSETILVVGFAPDDLAGVPLAPQPGVEHLPAWLQSLLRDQMGANSQAWVMGHSDNWGKTLGSLPFLRIPRQNLDTASQVQTLAFWLRFENAIYVRAACRCKDAAAAQALEEYVLKNGLAEPGAVEIRKDVWVTVQTETSAAAIRQRTGQGISEFFKRPKKERPPGGVVPNP
jgi:hypothetical protein